MIFGKVLIKEYCFHSIKRWNSHSMSTRERGCCQEDHIWRKKLPPVSARGLNLWRRLVPCNEDKVRIENIENSALLSTNRPRREPYDNEYHLDPKHHRYHQWQVYILTLGLYISYNVQVSSKYVSYLDILDILGMWRSIIILRTNLT